MISAVIIFLSMNFSNLIPDIDIPKIIDDATSGSAMEIAADSAFTNKTLKFNAGQTIYVRVTAENDGSDKHVLNLRDNNYSLITTYSMTKSDSEFLVNFTAPSSAGIYSLEANITSSGSVANFVKTIEVGEGGAASSQVNVKINNQVNTGNQVLSENDQVTSSPLPSALEKPDSQSYSEPGSEGFHQGFFASIWARITEFFGGFFGS